VYGICSIARGSSLLAFEVTPKIWDIAGSWLVVEEAGGVIETFSTSPPFPPTPNADYVSEEYPILAAATIKIASNGKKWITPKN
jgi:myo-inositol-1(or 4)-monophosphatase